MPVKLILDVDTGGDDAVAMLLAGHHPALDLAAVCVTHGNAPLDVTLENTLRLLSAGSLDHVPVYAGAAGPLVASPPPMMETQRAYLPLAATTRRAEALHAALFLIEYYLSPAGSETVYVPVGPQTNLALALRMEPRLSARIPRIVTMGGAAVEGNTTASAEFNIYADPEAADIVFTSGIPITMIGLEVTGKALVTMRDVEAVRSIGTPWAAAAANLMARDVQWFKDHLGWDGGQIFDACAVAGVIEPDLVTTQRMHVAVELTGTHTRGRTVVDPTPAQRSAAPIREPNVDVGVDIDREQFLKILSDGLH